MATNDWRKEWGDPTEHDVDVPPVSEEAIQKCIDNIKRHKEEADRAIALGIPQGSGPLLPHEERFRNLREIELSRRRKLGVHFLNTVPGTEDNKEVLRELADLSPSAHALYNEFYGPHPNDILHEVMDVEALPCSRGCDWYMLLDCDSQFMCPECGGGLSE